MNDAISTRSKVNDYTAMSAFSTFWALLGDLSIEVTRRFILEA